MNNESVGKRIVEALKRQAEMMDIEETPSETLSFDEPVSDVAETESFDAKSDIFAEPEEVAKNNFFDDVEEKWVVAPHGITFSKDEIMQQVAFQERFFKTEIRM